MKSRSFVFAFALAATLPFFTPSVGAAPKPDGTERQTAQPWTGSASGPNGGFESADRDQLLKIPTVMDDLGLKPGSVVADVGAGGGWLSVRLAKRVAPGGTVYANDILPKYLNYIDSRARIYKLSNIKTVLGTTNDPKLPANTMDAVVILNAYHEFDEPLSMLKYLFVSMKRGARLGIMERDNPTLRAAAREAYARTGKILQRLGEVSDNNPYTDDHRLAREVVDKEALACGFRRQLVRQLGADNYIAVFVKP